MALPPPNADQPYWDVSALMSGEITIPGSFLLANPPNSNYDKDVPVLSFLLQSSSHPGVKFVFDLGIRKDVENYPPGVVAHSLELFKVRVPQDVVEALEKGGLGANDITHICISHSHYDHIGDPSKFPEAKIIVGGECRSLYIPGYPEDPLSWHASNLLPPTRTIYLPPTSDTSKIDTEVWKPLGPFPHAYDYFGDGSLYFIDVGPGHIAGHINLLVRTSPDGGWAYLGGDCAHDWRHIIGEEDLSEEAHVNVALSRAHVSLVRRAREANERLRVLLAHDAGWYLNGEGEAAFWPGKVVSE